jgi:N4-(beta-N-acetylglucosaminyl)-L-asparaginase
MMARIGRRDFLERGIGLSAGALLAPDLLSPVTAPGRIPIIVCSHANRTGEEAVRLGWEVLATGGTAVDAIEQAANHVEDDPEDMSVGYGGAPNEYGVVQLDASIMDGRTFNAGAVAGIEDIRHPCSVARVVMEQTDHVLLVAEGARAFARRWGFPEEDLLTEKARQAWLRWRTGLNDRDAWGPPEHLRGRSDPVAFYEEFYAEEYRHGTVNVLAVDTRGDVAGITTTSGMAWKIPGRVGDSPIIGAGLYVDNDAGAAGAVGRGEEVIKSCASYYIVLRMAQGRTPEQACLDALEMLVRKYRHVNPDYRPGEHFVALGRDGTVGCAAMTSEARMSVRDADGYRVVEGPQFSG